MRVYARVASTGSRAAEMTDREIEFIHGHYLLTIKTQAEGLAGNQKNICYDITVLKK